MKIIEIPKRMRTLAKDSRGYPVPYIILIDRFGQPQFTINDTRRVLLCMRKSWCTICGKPLDRSGGRTDFWFVGGSRCFLHDHGVFLDPPLHLECAEYALCVCPFLAARRYSRSIELAKLPKGGLPDNTVLVASDFTLPRLPERFGLGLTHDYVVRSRSTEQPVLSVQNWKYVEWWRGGEQIDAPATGESPSMDQ